MKVLGLTGSIGMGKSLVAAMLRRRGIAVFDSDRAVHNLLAPNGKAFETVALTFPESWDKKHHLINRRKLGEIIFVDPTAKSKLEAILHPLVTHEQKRFILKSRRMGRKNIALDIPLLFETGGERKCDKVICVTAPYFLQRQRVLVRTGMTEAKFKAIISPQIPDTVKRRLADIYLHTGLGRAATWRSLTHTLKILKG